MSNFVHLHGHTEYSLLDGLSKIKKLVKAAKAMGMPAIAVTDHGAMYGAIEFYKEAKKAEIKPIIGCELYVARRSHKDKEGKLDTEPYHLTILAKNYDGYKNLMKLVSIGYLDGYYYKPRVDRELLKQYHNGLIALSGCPAGELIRNIKNDNYQDAEEVAKAYTDIFGEENYYLEIQNHEYNTLLKAANLDPKVRSDLEKMGGIQDLTWDATKTLSKKLGLKIVATNDYHYVAPDDAEAQDAVVCVQTGKFLKDIDRMRMIDTPNLYIRSSEEVEQLFKDIPESVTNTLEIAEKVDVEITLGKAYFPIFDIPQGFTPIEHLRNIVRERFSQKFDHTEPKYQERLERMEYELSVIEQKGYATYFLIVSDFMNWAQGRGIITNTRGSAAGSFVLFLTGITNIDPIDYLLPFERFLNPERPSLPDIDADLADDRRDEVIRYVTEKYGADKVAQIVTFGTMMGRAAIRDVGRVLGMPYADVDRIAKLVPPPHQGFHKPLEVSIKEVTELSDLYKSDQQVKKLLDLAVKVEGTVRHASVHAAGIVIAPDTLTNYTPLQRESNGDKIITQYDMNSVGEDGVGLVKMDFLGIRNLSILGHSVKIVKENRGIEVNLKKLPMDDKKTFELLARGDTMGLFQIESEGMTKYLMELKPTNIFDIMAMIALYRPGPLSVIPDYISRKHDPSKITYFDPRMRTYLERSLGLLVYQDDVMLTAINIAGYSWLEADKFRKAMGKKIPEEMAKQKDHFFEGCIQNGLTHGQVEELWKMIEPFAAYGFNKAHAASYSMVTFQTAYMKANFPVEFMAAVMTAEYGDTDKIAAAMDECKRMGVSVLPPDVNKSRVGFTIENLSDLSEEELKMQIGAVDTSSQTQGIRFGLSAIKNVGMLAIESIIEARKIGPFKSMVELISRVDNRLVNRKTLESLIKAGALDTLGSRAAHMAILEQCLELAHQKAKKTVVGQVGLFGEDEAVDEIRVELPNIAEFELDQLLVFEKELLGFFIHEPPFFSQIKASLIYCTHKLPDINEDLIGKKIITSGLIADVKKVVTKKTNAEMAFVRLTDSLSETEAVVFPTTYQVFKDIIVRDKVVLVWAKVDKREDKMSLIADKFMIFDPATFDPSIINYQIEQEGKRGKSGDPAQNEGATPKKKQEVVIYVPRGCVVEILKQVNKTLRESPGKEKVALILPNGGNNLQKMDLPFGIKMDTTLVSQIESLLGKGAIKLA